MKKFLFTCTLAIVCLATQAQYKKASFLNKTGRTYDIGGSAHLLSNGSGLMPGIVYSYGKDKGEKRLFHWFDLELLLPSKYKFTSIDMTTKDPVTISGKTSLGLVYRYNLACYLLDNTKEDNKLLPFVTGGINVLLAGGTIKTWTTDPEFADTEAINSYNNFSYGANGGIGVVYNLTSKFGFKATGGYNYQGNFTTENAREADGYKFRHPYTSHPYVTLGIRFKMERED